MAAADPDMKSVGRPRDPDIERRSIDAVLALYNDLGLAGLSFERVARQASVGKAALYSRWASVEELLVAGLRSVAPPPEDLDTGSLRTDLRQFVLTLTDLYSGPYGRVTVRVNLDAAVRESLRGHYDVFIHSYTRAAREVIVRAHGRGEIGAGTDEVFLLEQLVGATVMHVLLFRNPDRPLSLAAASAFADKLVDKVLAGVAPLTAS